MVMFLIFLLKFADGTRDADAYVIPSGELADCVLEGEVRAKRFLSLIDPSAKVIFICREEKDPFDDPLVKSQGA